MYWMSQLPFAVFFACLFLRRRRPCPDCGHLLPVFQSPATKTRRQWIEGGFLCPDCGCETDMSGTKVPAGTPPSVRSYVIGMGLMALVVGVGGVLLTLLVLRP